MTAGEVKDLKKEVKKYIDDADERMLKVVHAMFEADRKGDWWDEISLEEQLAIKESMQEIEQGKVTPHEDIVKKYAKWFSK